MSETLQTGLYLTVAGMGLVFLVLAMLWGLIVLLLKYDKESQPLSLSAMESAEDVAGEKPVRSEVVAAISVAIHKYNTEKGRRLLDAPFDAGVEDVNNWSLTGRAQQQTDWQPRRWN